ncbi:uncharacterized protein A4U43_C05F25350 [Asparagus officinalis]|uniref:ATPase AAA-type core domain-containing protein n=1 Tax=Asparagus officinalis TaxID=4686 RepID=A0A5P1EUI7_ASPOF|nr:uncharacterized protein A4U43_C05F25350 [Asparagus officinalis]
MSRNESRLSSHPPKRLTLNHPHPNPSIATPAPERTTRQPPSTGPPAVRSPPRRRPSGKHGNQIPPQRPPPALHYVGPSSSGFFSRRPLDRLLRTPTTLVDELAGRPPLVDALMAELRGRQAHQRKGCPDARQRPAARGEVELEQLVSRFFDDPSVSSVEALAPAKGFPAITPATVPVRRPPETVTDNWNSQKQTLCAQCTENYERELAKLVAKEFEKSSSDSRQESKSNLPQWLQIATPSSGRLSPDQFQSKEQELNWKQRMEELLKKWRQTCSRHHLNTFNLRSLPHGFRTMIQSTTSSEKPSSPPGSPVKTDLVLGSPKPENAHNERIKNSITSFKDSDSLKKLFKGLMEKVSWQTEAASAVTAAVLQAKSGNGKRRGLMPKADTWLLFIGSDKIGKKKMASALSELVFGVEPVTVRLGKPRNNRDDGEWNVNFRGRTALDRIADAVKRNPFSVVVLEDVDQADAIVRGTIKRAIERGRLPDSYGREVALGSAIFVLTANWMPEELKCSTESLLSEEKILNSVNSEWQLEISIGGKRLPDWLTKNITTSKRKKESDGLGLSLDLNLAAGGNAEDETGEGSWNSSDLTVEQEQEQGRLAIKHSASSASEFLDSVDSAVMFKPVDFLPLRRRVSESISAKFTAVIGCERSIRIDDDTLDRIVGGIWLSGVKIEEWAENVLVPSIEQLRNNLKVNDGAIVPGGCRGHRLPEIGCQIR